MLSFSHFHVEKTSTGQGICLLLLFFLPIFFLFAAEIFISASALFILAIILVLRFGTAYRLMRLLVYLLLKLGCHLLLCLIIPYLFSMLYLGNLLALSHNQLLMT